MRVNAESLDKLLKSASELHADMLLQNLSSQEVNRLGEEVAALEGQWNRTWKQIETMLRRGERANLADVLASGEHLGSEIKARVASACAPPPSARSRARARCTITSTISSAACARRAPCRPKASSARSAR